jgi:hypothetical protein
MSETMKDFWTKGMEQFADVLERMDYTEDSQVLRDAISQFAQLGAGEGNLKQGSLSVAQFMAGQGETLENVAHWLSPETIGSLDWSWLTKQDWDLRMSSMPSLPRVRMPSVSGPSLRGLPSTPSLSGSAIGSGLAWIAVVFLAVVLFWKWNNWVKPQEADAEEQWRLGPWPVAPDRVTTRGDLIGAFEHLALLLLGPAARTHNHHDLAQQIEQQIGETPGHDAVAPLARLYEQARYAPEQADANASLSPDEQAFARHALCLLAGLGPA